MAKVILFATSFLQNHPRAGEPTDFLPKIILGLNHYRDRVTPKEIAMLTCGIDWTSIDPKYTTIRAGRRFKKGDYFSPRIWSGKPYRSSQIIIAPDTLITDTWDFKIEYGSFYIDRWRVRTPGLDKIAKNDGLSRKDFIDWFIPSDISHSFEFSGQVIAWNPRVNYPHNKHSRVSTHLQNFN